MAIRVADKYGSRANPPTSAYPDGSIKNESVPDVSNDGTPLDQDWGNDWEGAKQAILANGNETPNGAPDSVSNPQILDALKKSGLVRAWKQGETAEQNEKLLFGSGPDAVIVYATQSGVVMEVEPDIRFVTESGFSYASGVGINCSGIDKIFDGKEWLAWDAPAGNFVSFTDNSDYGTATLETSAGTYEFVSAEVYRQRGRNAYPTNTPYVLASAFGLVTGGSHALNGDSNAAAFKRAINNLTYAYKVQVILPEGDIFFGDNEIRWGHYRNILGAGRESTTLIFNNTATDSDAISFDQFNYVSDFGMRQDGENLTSCAISSFVDTGTGNNGAANCEIKNIRVISGFAYGISSNLRLTFSNLFNTKVEGCRFFGCISSLYLGAAVNNTLFIDCWFKDSRGDDVRMSESLSATFINCAWENTGNGFLNGRFTLCQGVRIINPYFEPLVAFLFDTCPGCSIMGGQANGVRVGAGNVIQTAWSLNAGYSFNAPAPFVFEPPAFNTTDDLSALAVFGEAPEMPIRMIGRISARSTTLQPQGNSYVEPVKVPRTSLSGTKLMETQIISFEGNYTANGTVTLKNVGLHCGMIMTNVLNTSGSFQSVHVVGVFGTNNDVVTKISEEANTSSVYTLSIDNNGFLVYTDVTGASGSLSFQATFIKL
jgi:hypothetical protein